MGGADWKAMGWVEYQYMLEGWNAAHDPEAPKEGLSDPGGVSRFLAAHRKA